MCLTLLILTDSQELHNTILLNTLKPTLQHTRYSYYTALYLLTPSQTKHSLSHLYSATVSMSTTVDNVHYHFAHCIFLVQSRMNLAVKKKEIHQH